MELFYAEQFAGDSTYLTLSPEESHHISKVLRKKGGELIQLTDGKGHLIYGKISNSRDRELIVEIDNVEKSSLPRENSIELAVPVIRPNRMDWMTEKVTELGVQKIAPLLCDYSSYKKIKKKHLQKIAISAMKQSRQTFLPEIADPISFSDWLQNVQSSIKYSFIADPAASVEAFKKIPFVTEWPCRIAIGPEGGFSERELELADKEGLYGIKLGNTILRTETAAITALIIVKATFS
jgi:16S rRNA (uracil1498-N3)-methyltransferase